MSGSQSKSPPQRSEIEKLQSQMRAAIERIPKLSRRQSEIVVLAHLGFKDKNICDHLSLAMPTVRFHWRAIFLKLGIRDRYMVCMAYDRWRYPWTHSKQ
jgi:DNA-binding NarL/FixJ family response regulator